MSRDLARIAGRRVVLSVSGGKDVSWAIAEAGGSVEEIRYGLLHDASEAYLGDVVWPLKQAPDLAGYKEIEKLVESAIVERFGLPKKQPSIVKHFDLVLLATEKRDLMQGRDRSGGASREAAAAREQLGSWHSDVVAPLPMPIVPWSPEAARISFLAEFETLERLR